jgi:hypothetical protein
MLIPTFRDVQGKRKSVGSAEIADAGHYNKSKPALMVTFFYWQLLRSTTAIARVLSNWAALSSVF